jgi:hypothetical protein
VSAQEAHLREVHHVLEDVDLAWLFGGLQPMNQDEAQKRFIADLNACHDAWIEYAEARFGKPVEVWLTPEQLKERFGIIADGKYEKYSYMETAPGWSDAHTHFIVGYMLSRGHALDLESGNYYTWKAK